MNGTNKFVWIISVVALCAMGVVVYNIKSKPSNNIQKNVVEDSYTDDDGVFSDGLHNPDSVTTYQLDEDETGIAEKSVFLIDINHDKAQDRITRTFFENGNAHSYYEYKIELNKNGKYVDITPKNFKTINGADCDLQQIKFVFKPKFKVIMIYREMGDTWVEPTLAKSKTFVINDDNMVASKEKNLRAVCDVKELF